MADALVLLFDDALEAGCNFWIVVSARLIEAVCVTLVVDDDGVIEKFDRVLVVTGKIAGNLSLKLGRETLGTVLTMVDFGWIEPADGTFDLKWMVWMRFGTDAAGAAAAADVGDGLTNWEIDDDDDDCGWTRLIVAADDMEVFGNCTILFTVGGRIVLLDMIDICWLSGFGLFIGVVEK